MVLGTMSLLVLAGCGNTSGTANSAAAEADGALQEIKDSGKLVVGTCADYPPYEWHLVQPRFPKNYNVVGGTTPKVLYNCDCFFVISPTRTALPGFSNASMTSNSSSNSCIV